MDEEHDFERGDVVTLKTGGPSMFVVGYVEHSTLVACEYHNYGPNGPLLSHALVQADWLKLC